MEDPREKELPTVFEVFATIRSARDDLMVMAGDDKQMLAVCEDLNDIGDYDEPIINLVADLLNGSITPENKSLLERLVKE